MEIIGAQVLGEALHVATYSREFMLIGRRSTTEERHLRLKIKGHQRGLGRVCREVKEKSMQRKSYTVIGHELSITGIIHAK